MVRRIFVRGISVYSVLVVDGAGAVAVWDRGLYFSTSSRIILPSGPVPLMLDRGMPFSKAIFLAIGDAKIRSPRGSSDLIDGGFAGLSEGDGVDLGWGGSEGVWSDFTGLEAGDACVANAAAPERSSPSSARTAITEPTWTFLAPSCDYHKLYVNR